MLLYRTHNPPPALQPVTVATLTPFPAHDLNVGKGRAPLASAAQQSSWAIRSLNLPFASALVLPSILAAK